MDINTDYFSELKFGNDFAANSPVEVFYQAWQSFFGHKIQVLLFCIFSLLGFLSMGDIICGSPYR